MKCCWSDDPDWDANDRGLPNGGSLNTALTVVLLLRLVGALGTFDTLSDICSAFIRGHFVGASLCPIKLTFILNLSHIFSRVVPNIERWENNNYCSIAELSQSKTVTPRLTTHSRASLIDSDHIIHVQYKICSSRAQ